MIQSTHGSYGLPSAGDEFGHSLLHIRPTLGESGAGTPKAGGQSREILEARLAALHPPRRRTSPDYRYVTLHKIYESRERGAK